MAGASERSFPENILKWQVARDDVDSTLREL